MRRAWKLSACALAAGALSIGCGESRESPSGRRPRPAAGAGRASTEEAEATKGKTYRHPLGLSFWYPDGWAVTTHGDALRLEPPNPGSRDGSPAELYFIVADGEAGEAVGRADDPRMASYLDRQVSGLSRFVRRVGGPTPLDAGEGTGAEYNWQGKNPNGEKVCARAYASIVRNRGAALIAVAFEERLKARDADLRRVFASFGFRRGGRAP